MPGIKKELSKGEVRIEDKTTDPLFMKVGSEYYFYHNDHLGTPQKMTAVNGAVVWSAKYSSFGKATIEVETVVNNLRYPGQYEDQETGLHYNWWRYYESRTGRYLKNDPLGFLGGDLNLYVYCQNYPLGLLDPYGLHWATWSGFDFLDDNLNAIVGFGDGIISTLSFGFLSGDKLRNLTGLSPEEVGIDRCSSQYKLGRIGGTVFTLGVYATAAIPKTLTHFTTSGGARGIARYGFRPSSGGLFGGGRYASSTGPFPFNPLVPVRSKIAIAIKNTSGYIRTLAPGTYLKPTLSGYGALVGWNALYGSVANRDMIGECPCE